MRIIVLLFSYLLVLSCSIEPESREYTSVAILAPLPLEEQLSITRTGYQIKKVIEIAVRHINSRFDLLNQTYLTVDFLHSTSAAFPGISSDVLTKLTTKENILSIIGPYSTTEVLYLHTIASVFHIPIISGSATSHLLSEPNYQNFFRAGPSDHDIFRYLTAFMRCAKWRRIALLTSDSDFGIGILPYFQQIAQQSGIEIATTQSHVALSFDEDPSTASSQSHYLNDSLNIIQEMKTNVIVYNGISPDAIFVLRNAFQNDMLGKARSVCFLLFTRLHLLFDWLFRSGIVYEWILTSDACAQLPLFTTALSNEFLSALNGIICIGSHLDIDESFLSFWSLRTGPGRLAQEDQIRSGLPHWTDSLCRAMFLISTTLLWLLLMP
jgi:hypothetical protein